MKKIKIMQIIPEFDLGGAEIMVENLLISLSQIGYDVYGVSLYNKKTAITERLKKEKIPVIFLNKKRGIDLKIFIRLYKLFKKEKPYVVHTHLYVMPYVIPAAVLSRVPRKIHTIHNISKKEVSKSRRRFHSFFYKRCNVIPVTISPLVKDSVLEEYKFLTPTIPMIYNGINLTNCLPKVNYNINNNEIKIIHIGRFAEPKNHIGLINSFKLIVDKYKYAKLILIGKGELENVILQKVIDLKLEKNIVFMGQQPNVYKYLHDADIFILPSLWEGMPIALIEAMSTGLPIVATKVGGIPDMIEDDFSGLLVEPKEEQISSAVVRLINDNKLREKLGRNALVSAQNFSAIYMAKEYAKLYENK